jgi:hypothetical protein
MYRTIQNHSYVWYDTYMEKINPSTQLYTFFMSAYDHFNKELFESQLPDVILTLQRQAQTMGYFSSDRWSNDKGVELHEIAINPQYFAKYPIIEIFQTMVHEMVHLWQHEFGKPSRRSYHNRQWADKMIEVGLMPSSTGKPGGSQVGQLMADYPIKNGVFTKCCKSLVSSGVLLPYYDKQVPFSLSLVNVMNENIDLSDMAQSIHDELDQVLNNPIPIENIVYNPPTVNRSKTKYSCPECKLNMWGKPGLFVICGECDNQLLMES